jgi:hypothetical protein
MGVVDVDIGGLADSIIGGFDSLFTSDEERLAFEDKIEQRLHGRLEMQAKTNQQEAKHPSVFVSGWRPFLGWVCGVGIAFEFIARPLLIWVNDMISLVLGNPRMPQPPALDVEQLISLVVAMLGIAGYRTYEKQKGVARSL